MPTLSMLCPYFPRAQATRTLPASPAFHGEPPLPASARMQLQADPGDLHAFRCIHNIRANKDVNKKLSRSERKRASLQAYRRSSASVRASVLGSPVTRASSSLSSWISFCRRAIICKARREQLSAPLGTRRPRQPSLQVITYLEGAKGYRE